MCSIHVIRCVYETLSKLNDGVFFQSYFTAFSLSFRGWGGTPSEMFVKVLNTLLVIHALKIDDGKIYKGK